MDHFTHLMKNMLHKIQDGPDVHFSPIRMSEIASVSSLSNHTSRSVSEKSVSISNKTDILNLDTQNNNETADFIQSINHQEATDQVTKITITEVDGLSKVSQISNDLEKLEVNDTGSHDSVFSIPNRSPLLPKAGKTQKPRIVMGKRALLRSRSTDLEENPSITVHEMVNVNEKYHDQIVHSIGRIHKRRLSRESRNTDDDGTSSDYSAGSLNTIGTPDSLYNGNSYFPLFYPSQTECSFLKLSDNINKDTTAEIVNSTMNSVDTKDESSEYDPKFFLKNALGDTSFDSQSLLERKNISFPDSRLQNSQSMDTVNASALLSRAVSIYSSVRKSIRRACSFKERNLDDGLKNRYRGKERCHSFSPDKFGPAEEIMQKLYIQNGIIFQVSKALTYCKSNKDIASREYVEAEKILLVASCQKEALQTALDALEFGENDKGSSKYSGTLQISNIIYYLKGDPVIEEQPHQNNFTEHFVAVVTSGQTVLASEVLTPDKNGEIKVNKPFNLTGLTTDFEISLAIYSLKIKHIEKNQGSLLNIHKKDKKVPCPSPKSFFHFHHRSSLRNLQVGDVVSIKPSSFTLWGTCTIRCADLERTHFRMHHVRLYSSMENYLTAALSSNVTLTNRANGFLTIGVEDKSHLIWNRRWCLVEGPILKYWNYPSEEISSDPIGSIDLTCATEKVSPADRSVCPRPKSLSLLIKSNDTILKYFLSVDNSEEKQRWQEEINFVIGTLGAWNCLNSKTDS